MRIGGENIENICVKMMEGAIYTVDEVSDLLGIPRPTLYRYLREYSIPHVRREGRIQIPEDSFDRIREARDLHREGLVTETVRRQLREGSGPDTSELDRRLDNLHEDLRSLRGDLRDKPATDEVALSPTLRTMLARQSLMLSAMFNLTGMVEDLLVASGRPRRVLFEDLRPEPAHVAALPPDPTLQIPVPTSAARPGETSSPAHANHPHADRRAGFGALGRRRRRVTLAALAALLVGTCLAFLLPTLGGAGGASETARTDTPERAPAEEPAGGAPEAAREGVGDAGTDDATPDGGGDPTTGQDAPDRGSGDGGRVRTTTSEPDADDGIPDVSGRGVEEATRVLAEAGFGVAVIRTEVGPAEPGTVTGVEPVAGPDAGPVVLTTSAGPDGASPTSASASSSASASASASASVSTPAGASASPAP